MKVREHKIVGIHGESETLEFKSSTTQKKAAFETVCAMLNGKGGTVLIGVKNDGTLIGQHITDNTKHEIAREVTKIEPDVAGQIEIKYRSKETKKTIIAIKVRAGEDAPYTYDGRSFERNQNTTSRMKQHRYEQLLVQRGLLNHAWDESTSDRYDITDLDEEEIYRTVAEGILSHRIPAGAQKDNIHEILRRLKLTNNNKLTQAAVVLFAKSERLRLQQCSIKMARFSGKDKLGDFIDNQQLIGNAFTILNSADAFLRRHLAIASFFIPGQLKREDKSALPVLAVREALVNAICHRDYKSSSGSIALAIYDDRLEIWSNGILPSPLTVDDLKKQHLSLPRNALIANVFYIRDYIESWGRGTNNMVELCKNEGVPEPTFEEYSGGFSVTFPFRYQINSAIDTGALDLNLSARQREILNLLQDYETMSVKNIQLKLENSPERRTLQEDLTKLKNLGQVELIGKGISSKWKLA